MKRLKIAHRIALLFLVLLAVNMISLGFLNADRNEAIRGLEKERDGVAYLEPLRQLRERLPQFRRIAETDPKSLDPATNPPVMVAIDHAMKQLDDLDRKLEHELSTTEDFVGLKGDVANLEKSVSDPGMLRKAYEKAINRVRALVALTGDSAGLVLDNALESFYLVDVVVVDLPNEENLLNTLLLSGGKDAAQLLITTEALKRSLADINSHIDVVMHADPQLMSLEMQKQDHQMRVQALLAYLASPNSSLSEYAPMIQAVIDEDFRIYDAVSPTLDSVLQRRSAALRSDKNSTIELILLLSLAGLVLTVWIGWSIVSPIHHAIETLNAPGGEHVTMLSTNRDEISDLVRAATTRKPSTIAAETVQKDPDEALVREVQELKNLIVELSLENSSLKKSKPAGASSSH